MSTSARSSSARSRERRTGSRMKAGRRSRSIEKGSKSSSTSVGSPPPAQAAPVIRIDALSKHFASLRALDALRLTVPAGSIFGFIGPNGTRKSTTLDLLLGLMEPTSVSAAVLGYDTAHDAVHIRKRVGVLLDETGLYEELTAFENLTFYARACGMEDDRLDVRTRELLSGGNLWERRDDIVGSWSKGMQQRLALARAQLHEPDLLVLDEPTAGLDVVSARAVRAELVALADRGATIFLTTHDLAEAEQICTRVAIIDRGRVLAEGAPRALLATEGYDVTIRGEG